MGRARLEYWRPPADVNVGAAIGGAMADVLLGSLQDVYYYTGDAEIHKQLAPQILEKAEHQGVVTKLLALDPRGGLFSQDDMAAGVDWVCGQNEAVTEQLQKIAIQKAAQKDETKLQDLSVTKQQVAYNVRVILRSFRHRFYHAFEKSSKEFPAIAKVIGSPGNKKYHTLGVLPVPVHRFSGVGGGRSRVHCRA